jgi:hypothetical protein
MVTENRWLWPEAGWKIQFRALLVGVERIVHRGDETSQVSNYDYEPKLRLFGGVCDEVVNSIVSI